jgi:hypothetical protein
MIFPYADLQKEIQSLRNESFSLIADFQKCLNTENSKSTIALIPILYAIWEKSFKDGIAICFKSIAYRYEKVQDLPPEKQTIWFRKAKPFSEYIQFTSEFFKSIMNTYTDGERGVTKSLAKGGLFRKSTKLLQAFQQWSEELLVPSKASEYVFLPGNANYDVIKINSAAIGLDIDSIITSDRNDSSKIFSGDLDAFIGKRNDICHGSQSLLLDTIPPKEMSGYINLTTDLTNKFLLLVESWIKELPHKIECHSQLTN